MNKLVENSINSRKDSIFNIYEVKDAKLLKEIDALFEKMKALGEECKDNVEFEAKLASSPLNQEYIALFTKISKSSNYILKESNTENHNIKTDKEYVADEIKSEVKYQMKDATLPARRIAREKATSKLRNTPIIGDILNVKQHLDLFGGFKRKKQYQEEQEALQKELEEQQKNQK